MKARYGNLSVWQPKEAWYNPHAVPASAYFRGKGVRKELPKFQMEYCKAYFSSLLLCPPCDEAKKSRVNAALPDGLLKNGGPAVNQFRAMIGEEKTERFLKGFMYCCG